MYGLGLVCWTWKYSYCMMKLWSIRCYSSSCCNNSLLTLFFFIVYIHIWLEFSLYVFLISNRYANSAVIRRQLRILPKEWVQEWQNLSARRFVMHLVETLPAKGGYILLCHVSHVLIKIKPHFKNLSDMVYIVSWHIC